VIRIGSDSSYAPNEFLAGDGKTVPFDISALPRKKLKFSVCLQPGVDQGAFPL
jgi:hypothetical protein